VAYLCSSDVTTYSFESSRRSSLAFLVPRCGTRRRLHPAWIATRQSVSWPYRAPSPTIPLGALCHRIPGACQIFFGTSPRHPAQGNIHYRVLNSCGIRLLKGTATYIHALLSPAYRLQVTGHHRWVDKVVSQKLQSAMTSRRCL
jgi:hypothetical protein